MLVLFNPEDDSASIKDCVVAKSLDLLKPNQNVWIICTADLAIRAVVKRFGSNFLRLETKDCVYYIDEPDDDELIPGVFVTVSFPKISTKNTDWGKEGF